MPRAPEVERRPGRRFPYAVIDTDRCTACGMCEEVCATGAIRVREHAVVDEPRCIGCGECVAECPEEAIGLAPPV
jgi:NAD-dependent dihydropyrimidine dehydrogenase PreA subunit